MTLKYTSERKLVRQVDRFAVGSNQYKRRIRSNKQDVITWKNTRMFLSLSVFTLIMAPYLSQSIMDSFNRVLHTQYESKPKLIVYAKQDKPEPMVTEDPIQTEQVRFLRVVRIKESSNGTNSNPEALHNICKRYGKVNTVGWTGMQGYRKWLAKESYPGEYSDHYCFKSSEEEAGVVTRRYQELRETLTEAETYCMWNIGVKTNDCKDRKSVV